MAPTTRSATKATTYTAPVTRSKSKAAGASAISKANTSVARAVQPAAAPRRRRRRRQNRPTAHAPATMPPPQARQGLPGAGPYISADLGFRRRIGNRDVCIALLQNQNRILMEENTALRKFCKEAQKSVNEGWWMTDDLTG